METTADLLALDTSGVATPADSAMLTELDGFTPVPNRSNEFGDAWAAMAAVEGDDEPRLRVDVWLGDPATAVWVIR